MKTRNDMTKQRPSKTLVFLIIVILLFANGCYYYKAVQYKNSTYNYFAVEQFSRTYILHTPDTVLKIAGFKPEKEKVRAYSTHYSGNEYYKETHYGRPNRYRKTKNINESGVLRESHIFADNFTPTDSSWIELRYSDINAIYDYKKDNVATAGSWVFSSALIGAAAVGAITGIAILLKGSCPFIYTYNGTEYLLEGEIYSGAIHPVIEREDYLPLSHPVSENGKLQLMITNEVREIQNTNMLELISVEHPAHMQVLIDKYGNIQSLSNNIAPERAISLSGRDLLEQIKHKDGRCYSGGSLTKDSPVSDAIITEFMVPDRCSEMKLHIRAKNSFWMEYVFHEFHMMLGDRYKDFSQKKAELSSEDLVRDMLDQELVLSVYIMKNESWEFVDYFNIAGPIALKEDVLSIPVGDVTDGICQVKIEYGTLFWDIDFIGADLTNHDEFTVETIPLLSAIDENGNSVKPLMEAIDTVYYSQPDVGNSAILEFNVPDNIEGRSFFLHSSGYYTILRNTGDKAQIRKLKRMKKRGGLPYLSKELYLENRPIPIVQ